MATWGFLHDSARCTGCKACVMACKDLNDLSSGMSYRRVLEYGGGSWKSQTDNSFSHEIFIYYLSIACNHCAEPICVQVCPTGAMHSDDEGIISVNRELCIGCRYCQLSCPYHAPKVDPVKGQSAKCDACRDYRRAGSNNKPACVNACPMRALDFGSMDELRPRGSSSSIAPLPLADETKPNLLIRPHRDARPSGSSEGRLQNDLEL